MSTKKISVIVPVYNVATYLPKCLDSLIAQTYSNIDIFCINDGSTDNSLDILKEYAKKDKRIHVISQKNGGLSAARNTGLNNVKTKYVMFCDSDDYYDKTMCDKMLHAIENNAVDVAACGTKIHYYANTNLKESDDNYYRLRFEGKHRVDDKIIEVADVSVCNKIFRMELIHKYNILFPPKLNNEDFYFWNVYAAIASTIYYLDQKLYHYSRRENSIMSKNFQKNNLSLDHLLCAEKIFDFYDKNKILDKNIDRLWYLWIISFDFSVRQSHKDQYKKIYQHADQFLKANKQNIKLSSKAMQKRLNAIQHPASYRARRKAKSLALKIHHNISLAYKQQLAINRRLEEIIFRQEQLLSNHEGEK